MIIMFVLHWCVFTVTQIRICKHKLSRIGPYYSDFIVLLRWAEVMIYSINVITQFSLLMYFIVNGFVGYGIVFIIVKIFQKIIMLYIHYKKYYSRILLLNVFDLHIWFEHYIISIPYGNDSSTFRIWSLLVSYVFNLIYCGIYIHYIKYTDMSLSGNYVFIMYCASLIVLMVLLSISLPIFVLITVSMYTTCILAILMFKTSIFIVISVLMLGFFIVPIVFQMNSKGIYDDIFALSLVILAEILIVNGVTSSIISEPETLTLVFFVSSWIFCGIYLVVTIMGHCTYPWKYYNDRSVLYLCLMGYDALEISNLDQYIHENWSNNVIQEYIISSIIDSMLRLDQRKANKESNAVFIGYGNNDKSYQICKLYHQFYASKKYKECQVNNNNKDSIVYGYIRAINKDNIIDDIRNIILKYIEWDLVYGNTTENISYVEISDGFNFSKYYINIYYDDFRKSKIVQRFGDEFTLFCIYIDLNEFIHIFSDQPKLNDKYQYYCNKITFNSQFEVGLLIFESLTNPDLIHSVGFNNVNQLMHEIKHGILQYNELINYNSLEVMEFSVKDANFDDLKKNKPEYPPWNNGCYFTEVRSHDGVIKYKLFCAVLLIIKISQLSL